jgi:diphosphomevalonate decarboxylase
LAKVRELRANGMTLFVTMDAGPQVKVLSAARDASEIARALGTTPGVTRVLEARPAEGARTIDASEVSS